MLRDLLPQPFGESHRSIENSPRKNQEKLLAAITTDAVDLAGFAFQQLRKFLQYRVAGLVSVLVVDGLEFVDVAHDHRDRLVQPHGGLPPLRQSLPARAPGLYPGEPLGEGNL